MLLVLDNYDSFTWNLVQLLGELGADPVVVRNDALTVEDLLREPPSRMVVSPGPCTPSDAGVSVAAIRALTPLGVPVLGVCLGHQALAEAFGGRTIRARALMHGKVASVGHTGAGIFRDIPSPFRVTRYHSLVTDPAALPAELEVVAWSAPDAPASDASARNASARDASAHDATAPDATAQTESSPGALPSHGRTGSSDGTPSPVPPSGAALEIQAVRHREAPVWGVQFHPESLFSEHGRTLLGAFLRL
jgi:anthranilate synthase component 2